MSNVLPTRFGRYEVVRELGKGAMGIVYEGRDPNIGRRVAIKTARCDTMSDSRVAAEMMERFLREARAAGTLNHPGIVTIYDTGEEGGTTFIAMEFLSGADLQKHLKERRQFTVDDTVRIVAAVCEALGHAHEGGVVHRDVKPANIVLLDNGGVKVTDFGVAHLCDSNLTREGSVIGTPYYMSPEQFMGRGVDGRSDLFSCGIIAYEMLTGERPFQGEGFSAVMHNVLRAEPIPPRDLNYEINPVLSAVIMKALRKEPQRRYATGEAMAAALRESLKDHPDPALTGLETDAEDATATVVSGGKGAATVVTTVRAAAAAEKGGEPQATGPADAGGDSGDMTLSRIPVPPAKHLVPAMLVLAVMLAGAVMWLTGGGKAAEPGTPPESAVPGTQTLYEEIKWDGVLLVEFVDGEIEPRETAADTVDVKVMNGTQDVLSEKASFAGNLIELEPHLAAGTVIFSKAGYGSSKKELTPTAPGGPVAELGVITLTKTE